MIYNMVLDSLTHVRYRWIDLAQRFAQLRDKLNANHAPASVLDLFDRNAGNPPGFIQICQREADSISDLAENLETQHNLNALFANAIAGLETTLEHLRFQVVERFPPLELNDYQELMDTEIEAANAQIARLQESISQRLQEFEEVTTVQGNRYVVRGIRDSMENLTAYPVQTMGMETSGMVGSQPGGEVNLQKMVEGALRKTLGRLPRLQDTRSFMAALNQSFDIIDVEGHTEVRWKPRSFAGQTELGGGVAGAQASLYSRARVALENATPLLDSLYPLRNDSDVDHIYASRAIIISQFQELVNEMGVEGGPRVARVNGLFNSLLGPEALSNGPNRRTSGQMAVLRDDLGLTDEHVNTLEEETNLTNFISLNDYLVSLRDSWINYRDHAVDGKDLGTQLVLLSRALSVVAESVDETVSAMDSVFVGQAERQVAWFWDDNDHKIQVAELFDWISSFSIQEAPNLIHQGGRRGVEAIIPTTRTLENLIMNLIERIPREGSLPEGMRHPRVLHTLYELHGYLQNTADLAEKVQLDIQPSAPFSSRRSPDAQSAIGNGGLVNGGALNGLRERLGNQILEQSRRVR